MDSVTEGAAQPGGGGVPPARPLLVPGRTCWRIDAAERVAFVIDGENYFRAAIDAMAKARRSIALVAWDLDLNLPIEPGSKVTLLAYLERLVAERPDLHIRILLWDLANALALIRPTIPPVMHDWVTSERLRLVSDSAHPTGSCQHQKILVVDDAVAFCGGIEFSGNRWDTRAHLPRDPRRRLPNGTPCEPRHDVMMAVDGRAARTLGDLFRQRWECATGERLSPIAVESDPWPSGLPCDLRGVPVGIVRTRPAWRRWSAVHEVEALYLDSIRTARRWIYIENQYFASRRIAQALIERLREPGGPEVVVVTSNWGPSWLEHHTMNALRDRLVRKLRKLDRYGRFRIYAPFTGGKCGVVVHDKVMVVDDRLVRIGSANLNDRSMGADSECDLAIEAAPGTRREREIGAAIARFRNDLMAEHLGVERRLVARTLDETGSLIRAIETLRGQPERTLRPIRVRKLGALVDLLDNDFVNPSGPAWYAGAEQVILAGAMGAAGGWLLWRAWRTLSGHRSP